MAGSDNRREHISVQTLMIAAVFLLPVVLPLLFSWLDMLLAVPVFLLLRTASDERLVVRRLRNGLLIAAVGTMLVGEPALFALSLIMLPVGWSLHRSATARLSPAAAGGAAFVTLGLTWLAFWLAQGLLTGSNPYSSLLTLFDRSLQQLAEEARTKSDIPVEIGQQIATLATDIRSSGLMSKLLPALLVGSAVLTVWLNLVIGSGLLRRFRPDKAVWPEYRYWRLPDSLIWLLIAAIVLLLLGGGSVAQTGYALAVAAGLAYFFQGGAIFAHLLHRWQVPAFWRAVLYFFVAVQGYGMLLLTVTGVADTWADFRRLTQEKEPAGRS